MWLRKLTFDDALYVARNMREWDKREIYATRWTEDPIDLAGDAMRAGAFSWCAGIDDRPVCVIGATPIHPGVWNVWMFATDDFLQMAFCLTKLVRRVMIPAVVSAGFHRAECRSMDGHTYAQRWLEMLGFVRESTLVGFGRNREDFGLYVWKE